MTPPRLADIITTTCSLYGLSRDDILSPSRQNRVALPRQVGMYVARTTTSLSLKQVARGFRRSDHTTVMYAVAKVRNRMAREPGFRRDVEHLIGRVSE